MRVLTDVKPTPEQLVILADYRPGVVLIRGAAGSGKTTTAVLRLRFVTGVWQRQRARETSSDPIRVLVLTYNRTLRGYVEQLVELQIATEGFHLTLDTFSRWAMRLLGSPDVMPAEKTRQELWRLGSGLGYDRDFLTDEVDYVLGRFTPDKLADYADPAVRETYERRGRGTVPRVERAQRERLLTEVIFPYRAWKAAQGILDWPDVAVRVGQLTASSHYDIAIVDEAQDFSANQVRAVVHWLAERHSATFVMDAVQRIYPRGFVWREAGVDVAHSYRLQVNHRNTKQIAAFALPLVGDLPLEDDGTLPDFEACDLDGPRPNVIRGRFTAQIDWVIPYLESLPEDESVVLLHAKGGGWFDYVRTRLDGAGLAYVDLTRRREWPRGPEQIGLSTLHSAKGLEFDHVVILGLSAELMPHGAEEGDAQLATHRRLVAMAIGRGRKSVVVSFKPDEASRVVGFFDPSTYDAVDV